MINMISKMELRESDVEGLTEKVDSNNNLNNRMAGNIHIEEFKKLSPFQQIKKMTDQFPKNPNTLMDKLVMANLISRVELGDADAEFRDEIIAKMFAKFNK